MNVEPDELPLVDQRTWCPNCDAHDVPWPTSPPHVELVMATETYDGVVVNGRHFARRCQYCGHMWPEGLH